LFVSSFVSNVVYRSSCLPTPKEAAAATAQNSQGGHTDNVDDTQGDVEEQTKIQK
jgi:hypothetical protein